MPRKTLTQQLKETKEQLKFLQERYSDYKETSKQIISELQAKNKDLTTSLQIQKEGNEGLKKVNLELHNRVSKLIDTLEATKSMKPDSEYFTGKTTYIESGGTKPLTVNLPRSYPNEEELRGAMEIQRSNIIGGAGKILSQTIHREAHYKIEI